MINEILPYTIRVDNYRGVEIIFHTQDIESMGSPVRIIIEISAHHFNKAFNYYVKWDHNRQFVKDTELNVQSWFYSLEGFQLNRICWTSGGREYPNSFNLFFNFLGEMPSMDDCQKLFVNHINKIKD